MVENGLPLCPCGSGKLYEECCYKKKGADGNPLFYKGAMESSDGGQTWHPIPNVRFNAIVVGQEKDKYRGYAKDLVSKSTLPVKHHEKFINSYGLFYQSFEQLLEICRTPSGEGVSFQIDKLEVRKCWRDFLINGRILLDFIGLHSRKTLGLNQAIGGLNKNKYDNLLLTLQNLGARDKNFLDIKAELEALKDDIIAFISCRDEEKSYQDTIVDFPIIDSEFGLIQDGKISVNGNTYNMIEFINGSYESVHKLTLIFLCISN